MKKTFAIIIGMILAVTVVAGPPRGGGHHGGHRGGPPSHYHHHHHHHGGGYNGVRLATDIVNLVGAGLNIVRPTYCYPGYGYVAPAPVVVTPPVAPVAVVSPPPATKFIPVYDVYGNIVDYQRIPVTPINYPPVPPPPPSRVYYRW